MIPIRNDQPRTSFPWVNYFIIAANVAVFAYQISLGLDSREMYDFYTRYAVIPHNFELALAGAYRITFGHVFLTMLTAMFIHGSIVHLFGNIWVLWIFGGNIEDHLGHVVYPLFYLICGLLAFLAQVYVNPGSEVPNIGASGAIAGILGAFLLRYPQAKVQFLLTLNYVSNVAWVTAWVVLAAWFGLQLANQIWQQFQARTLASYGIKAEVGNVAYWAHLCGFVSGMILIKLIPGHTTYRHGGWFTKEGKEVLPRE
jgi:membrane associated rhomboid family serine protease